jgi:hypothetical protein
VRTYARKGQLNGIILISMDMCISGEVFEIRLYEMGPLAHVRSGKGLHAGKEPWDGKLKVVPTSGINIFFRMSNWVSVFLFVL